MSSKTICFLTTLDTLQYCHKVVFLFQSFLVITVHTTKKYSSLGFVSWRGIPPNDSITEKKLELKKWKVIKQILKSSAIHIFMSDTKYSTITGLPTMKL